MKQDDQTKTAVRGSELSAELGPVPERWYCVSTDGMAMLCKDERDARLQAAESDALYPVHAPHRAVRLGDVAAERERLVHACKGIAAGYAGEARRLDGQHATHAAGRRDGANECAAAILRA